jgi:hypothetical protein
VTTAGTSATPDPWTFETLRVQIDGGVVFAEIAAPPMNLLGPELVRDLVSLIQRAEADGACKVLVFTSGSTLFRSRRQRTSAVIQISSAPACATPRRNA